MSQKSRNSSSVRVNAAALQDHLSRSLQLSPARRVRPNRASSAVGQGSRRARQTARQPRHVITTKQSGPARRLARTCQAPETASDIVVLDKGPEPTLAQRIGLVEAPRKPLSLQEWQAIQDKQASRDRGAQSCAICQERFGKHPQVLLSCTHSFHKACLSAYERYAKTGKCPMCRTAEYQKCLIRDGAKHHAAATIQAAWRGYEVRKWYSGIQRDMDSRRTAVRARAERHRALARVTERIVSATAQRHAAVTDFLAELDSSRIHRRQILAEALATQRLTESEWERVQAAASGRLEDNCPICLFPLEPLSRPCYLLSCSHVFHENCMRAFEVFACNEDSPVCPVCRNLYERRLLQIEGLDDASTSS